MIKQLNFEEYIKKRYNPQIKWYDHRAKKYKVFASLLQISIIAFAAIVPILASLSYKWPTIILSALVAIMTGTLKYTKIEELWHNYRTICETLKKEKHYFDFRIGVYANVPYPKKLFVEKIESFISKENTVWLSVIKKKEKK